MVKVNKILVSQPRPSSDKSPYFDIEKKYGVEIVFRPFIKVEGLTSKEFRQQKISLPEHTAVIFTAKSAIDHFFRIAEETRFNVPETMKYFCTTEAIALYLQKYTIYRKRKIFFGKSGKLDDFQEGEAFDYDMLIFFSPTGIKSLQKNFPNFEQGDIKIGCFGVQTAKAVTDAGLRLDIEAPTANAPSMTAALEQYLKENNK